MTMMLIMTKRKEQVQNLIPRLDRNRSRSALTNDDEDEGVNDNDEGEGGDADEEDGDVDGSASAVMKVPVVDMIDFVWCWVAL